MATTRWRHLTTSDLSGGAAVAQVDNFEITNAGGGSETWTWTITLADGSTHTETFVDDGTPSTAEIVTLAIDTWNNSTNPHFAKRTAAGTDPDVTLTADTAGIPQSVTLGASGTGTVSKTATTANVGINDVQFPDNWSEGAIPTTGDDVVLESGNVDLLYRLNLSSVAIGDFIAEPGCQSNIGRLEFGKYQYLRLDPDGFEYRGGGRRCLFDLGSANISPFIESFGQPFSQNQPALFLKGSNLATAEIARGSVGIGFLDDDTATVDTVLAGSGQPGDVILYLGSGVTLSTALTLSSGSALVQCAMPTATVAKGGTLTTRGTGGITTKLNCHGLVYANSSGTIAEADVKGVLDFTQDRTARTISLLNPFPGGKVRLGSWITVTAWGDMDESGEFTIEWVE